MSKFNKRINKMEVLTKINLVIDDEVISDIAIDVALRMIDTQTLKKTSDRYDKKTNDLAFKEIEKKVKYYQKLITKHKDRKDVRDICIKKSDKKILSEEDYQVILRLK